MSVPVIHFEIVGKDGKKLQDFYRSLFQWKIDANNPMQYGLVEAAKGGIGGGIAPVEPGGAGRVTIYAGVDDPDAYLKKAEQLGGKTVVPTTEIPNMVTFAIFSDPEGNLFGLVKDSGQ
jgi:uncharacterized protein